MTILDIAREEASRVSKVLLIAGGLALAGSGCGDEPDNASGPSTGGSAGSTPAIGGNAGSAGATGGVAGSGGATSSGGSAGSADAGSDAAPSKANLLYSLDWADVPVGVVPDKEWMPANAGMSYSRKEGRTEIIPNGMFGNKSAVFSLVPPYCKTTNCTGSVREEVYPAGNWTVSGEPSTIFNNAAASALNNTFWVGYAVKYTQFEISSSTAVLFQVQQHGGHSTACDGPTVQPFIALNVSMTSWNLSQRRWKVLDTCADEGDPLSNFTAYSETLPLPPLPSLLGEVIGFVWRIQLDPTPGAGRLTLSVRIGTGAWVQVYDNDDYSLGYNVLSGQWMQWMQLKLPGYHWNASATIRLVAEMDEFKVSLPNQGGFEDVAPPLPK